MYKIFHGFALVEAYQNLKKAKRLAENKSVSRFVKLAIAIVVSLVLWCLPIEIFGVEGLTVIEQRLISITTVQRNYPIGSVDLNRNHSSDVLV